MLDDAAKALGPGGALYLPFNIALIVFFNYYYTFLQVINKGMCVDVTVIVLCGCALLNVLSVIGALISSWV